MKKTILLLFCILVYSQEVTSQNTIFIGEKTYPCSQTYLLGSIYPKLEILFIKDEEQGMIAVATDNNLVSTQRIKGKLIIYLDNNTTITCLDNNKFDVVNRKATTIYHITKDEIYRLKNTNISGIRYSIGGIDTKYSQPLNPPDDYLVQNIREGRGSYPDYSRTQQKVDFPSIIRELFD